jgi:hypothetical protein
MGHAASSSRAISQPRAAADEACTEVGVLYVRISAVSDMYHPPKLFGSWSPFVTMVRRRAARLALLSPGWRVFVRCLSACLRAHACSFFLTTRAGRWLAVARAPAVRVRGLLV